MKLAFPLLVVLAFASSSLASSVRGVTNEDIRDAILSLIHMFRDSTDKLERHEYRERTLGEHVKRVLAGLDKRARQLEQNGDAAALALASLDRRLQALEDKNGEGLGQWTAKLDALASSVERLHDPSPTLTPVAAELNTESLLGQLEARLAALQQRDDTRQRQLVAGLATREELAALINGTHEQLHDVKYELLASTDKGFTKVEHKMADSQKALTEGQEELHKVVSEAGVVAENAYGAVQKSYEQLLAGVVGSGKGLAQLEQVMVTTADNVLDTKRRIEYGVHQILLEVGDLVQAQSKDLNSTVNKRFDNISIAIMDNQNGALTNLSSKIETEISQVWRQIGIMYQQLTASAGALDRLQQQTDAYVNGSLHTMDSMEGKVGQITGRMGEVDDNLNYLLGRLSLVTQEFNQIKDGLGQALDSIRASFKEVQRHIAPPSAHPTPDPSPGPLPVDDDHDNRL